MLLLNMVMRFITAQPDQQYFLWQLQVQLTNFRRLGLEQACVILIGVDGEPSALAKYIEARTTAQVVFIPDTRADKNYAPSIQPHLYAKYVADHPNIGECMLLDSDVIFRSMPAFVAPDPGTCRVSDTSGYLGYEYVVSKGQPQFHDMCSIVGIDPEVVKARQRDSGGAQWVMNGMMTAAFWIKVERDCNALYVYMRAREPQWRGEGYAIQAWTAGMWAQLWNVWLAGYSTVVAPELHFCWASDTLERAGTTPILHVAGVVDTMKETHFYKGKYVGAHPFHDPAVMAITEASNASHLYAIAIREAKDEWEIREP